MAWALVQHGLTTLLLAIVVMLICRWRRVSPALHHAAWVLVLVKLATPPVLAWPWTLQDVWPAAAPTNEPVVVSSDLFDFTKLHAITGPVGKLSENVQRQPATPVASPKEPGPIASLPAPKPDAAPVEHNVASVESAWIYERLALWAWLIGAVAMACWQVVAIARFQQRLRHAMAAPRWLQRMVRELAVKFDVRPPRIALTTAVRSPVLWHLGQPTLLWPGDAENPRDPGHWRGVVAHELAHLRRKDHWWGWLLLLTGCVWWWHPLYWLARRQIRFHAELACDAWVTWAFPDDRRAYAEALIAASARTSSVALAPAWGIGGGPRHHFRRRLTMIMSERVGHRVPWRTLFCFGMVAAISLPAWSTAQTPQIQAGTDLILQEQRLRQTLADLEVKKKQLEDELAAFQKRLADYKAAQAIVPAPEIEKERQSLNKSIDSFRKAYGMAIGDLSNTGKPVVFADGSVVDLNNLTRTPRNWGPEQATGAPNAQNGNDDGKAWASLTEDDQDEWLELGYEKAVNPVAAMIFENFNPGAVYKVSVITDDGRELEVWKGEDPSKPGSGSGVSLISFKIDFKDLQVSRVKIYLQSTKVRGWNEIDAVGLLDTSGNVQWATKATASSTYADKSLDRYDAYTSLLERNAVADYVDVQNGQVTRDHRLNRVERQIGELKNMVEKLLARSQGEGTSVPGSALDKFGSSDAVKEENRRLRDEVDKLKQFIQQMQKSQ